MKHLVQTILRTLLVNLPLLIQQWPFNNEKPTITKLVAHTNCKTYNSSLAPKHSEQSRSYYFLIKPNLTLLFYEMQYISQKHILYLQFQLHSRTRC